MAKKSEKEANEEAVADIRKCLAPGQDEWVYDYFNQQLDEAQEEAFEEHLFECDRCQDIILMLDWAYTELRSNAQQYARPPAAKTAKRRPATKAKSSKG